MFRTASDPGTTGTEATYDFVVTDLGSVGIGTTAPLVRLHVVDGNRAHRNGIGSATHASLDRSWA